jgi:hypothetical protein
MSTAVGPEDHSVISGLRVPVGRLIGRKSVGQFLTSDACG